LLTRRRRRKRMMVSGMGSGMDMMAAHGTVVARGETMSWMQV